MYKIYVLDISDLGCEATQRDLEIICDNFDHESIDCIEYQDRLEFICYSRSDWDFINNFDFMNFWNKNL